MNDYKRIQKIIDSVTTSLESKSYFAALITSMVLIDTCSLIEQPDESSVRRRYTDWVEDYLLKRLHTDDPLSAKISKDNIYYLRCALLHESSTNLENQRDNFAPYISKENIYDVVPFVNEMENDSKDKIIEVQNGNDTHPTLYIDIDYFIEQILSAIDEWITDNHEELMKTTYNIFSLAILRGNPTNDKTYFIR